MMTETISVTTTITAPLERVWEYYTGPEHIVRWNAASDDWCTTHSENDVRVGGRFSSRMEAKDGSAGFDFSGVYTRVELYQDLLYTLDDGRTVQVRFSMSGEKTMVSVTFEAETMNSVAMQRDGWQAILNRFKEYVERRVA